MRVAAIQINAGPDKAENLAKAKDFILEAKADFIALPEVFNYRGGPVAALEQSEDFANSQSIKLIQELASQKNAWVLIGSLMLKSAGLPFNSSVLISPQGEIMARYDKMHLFDMDFKGQSIRESERNQAGNKPMIAKIGEMQLGMSICYDLRFPELYRHYAKSKVELIAVPSAFTKITGEAHWHSLLRARAIENQAYVIAPNQAGDSVSTGSLLEKPHMQGLRNSDKAELTEPSMMTCQNEHNAVDGAPRVGCYGHSLIVDPWGGILAEAGEQEEIIYADLDLAQLKKVRARLPVLEHMRMSIDYAR